MQVASVVERDRLQEHAHPAVLVRGRHAGAQHRGGIVRPGRRCDHHARQVAQGGDAVVVVEVTAEALLVSITGDAQDHRVPVLAVGEEAQRAALTAQLVGRVVDVGEVLDLGDRQQAGQPGAERGAQDALLVQQRVEHLAAAELLAQPARHAVHPTLAGDIFAEDHDARVAGQFVGQRPVDRLRQGQRPLGFREPVAEGFLASRGNLARPACDGVRSVLADRGHHLGGAAQLSPAKRLIGDSRDLGTLVLVAREHLVGPQNPVVDERLCRGQQRIASVIPGYLGSGPVTGLHVRPGVPHQPHRPQVQESRSAVLPNPVRGLLGHRQATQRIRAVDGEVPQAVAVTIGGLDPALRRAHADADAVVLAHQQQRHRQALESAVQCRVDRAGRGGVVGRGVAETAHHHGVRGPGRRHPELGRPAQRERQSDRAWQVRGDGRGLRDDGQFGITENLVPPGGNRLVGRGDDAQQHVAQRVLARHLQPAAHVETAGAVVQQRRIRRPQRGGDRGVGLVPGRTDAVEALPLRTQQPRPQVQVPATGLGVEQCQQLLGQPGRRGWSRWQRGDRVPEVLVDRLGLVAHRSSVFCATPLVGDGPGSRRNDHSRPHGASAWCGTPIPGRPSWTSPLMTPPVPRASRWPPGRRTWPGIPARSAAAGWCSACGTAP